MTMLYKLLKSSDAVHGWELKLWPPAWDGEFNIRVSRSHICNGVALAEFLARCGLKRRWSRFGLVSKEEAGEDGIAVLVPMLLLFLWRLVPDHNDFAIDVRRLASRATHCVAQQIQLGITTKLVRKCPLPQPTEEQNKQKRMSGASSCSNVTTRTLSSGCITIDSRDSDSDDEKSDSCSSMSSHNPLVNTRSRRQTTNCTVQSWAYRTFMQKGSGFLASTDKTLSDLGIESGPKTSGHVLAETFTYLNLCGGAKEVVKHMAGSAFPSLHLSMDATRCFKREAHSFVSCYAYGSLLLCQLRYGHVFLFLINVAAGPGGAMQCGEHCGSSTSSRTW